MVEDMEMNQMGKYEIWKWICRDGESTSGLTAFFITTFAVLEVTRNTVMGYAFTKFLVFVLLIYFALKMIFWWPMQMIKSHLEEESFYKRW